MLAKLVRFWEAAGNVLSVVAEVLVAAFLGLVSLGEASSKGAWLSFGWDFSFGVMTVLALQGIHRILLKMIRGCGAARLRARSIAGDQ